MPIEGWYTIAEVCTRTGMSYFTTLRWIHEQERATPRPPWLRKLSKAYLMRAEGIQLLMHAKGRR